MPGPSSAFPESAADIDCWPIRGRSAAPCLGLLYSDVEDRHRGKVLVDGDRHLLAHISALSGQRQTLAGSKNVRHPLPSA
jgi:hypothetical protein